MIVCKNCRANGICDGIVGDCEQTDKIAGKIYEQGRADQKEEDNAFFNFEGAWELEKKKVRADAINEYVTRFEAENITDANAEKLKPFIFEMHRLAEQMQEGQGNE